MEHILEKYNNLPDENDSTITVQLRDIVVNLNLEEIEKEYLPFLENKQIEDKIRFLIYYSISIYYRRYEHHSKFFDLVRKYSKVFASHPLNYVILSLYYKYRAIDHNCTEDFKYAIENAERAVSLLPGNSAVLNNYAELIATSIDEKYPVQKERIVEAIDRLDQIISFESAYAKWYYTKGKLLFSIKEYHEAKECVRIAIDLETADNKDSLLRIAQYNNTLLDFRINETIENLEQKLQDSKNVIDQINNEQSAKSKSFFAELDDVKSKYMEFLAFFAAIIAFITSSINIVTTYGNAVSAGGLIVILAGALSMAFCIFRMLISYSRKIKRVTVFLSIMFSLLLMISGFIVCFYTR